ncbi:MAG TPA: ABC transporter ATP-binding protein [Gammaproteobacteria bacterium]|nr:ABC transporter ATP-binding protein [Gammaproteobacteria bacterium]
MDDAIRLTDLEVRYGRVRALDGLSLAVPRGEIYGFLGRNGAGKTTTLRVLMGIVRADGGTIELFGKPMKRVSVATKRGIGYVSQEQNFYPWMTPRQLGRFVAAFYPSWDDAEYARLLRVLDVPPDRRTVQLSGGTRTKVGLALALAPRPPLLLLDEPTSGLDPVARREFDDRVVAMAAERGITVFLSSHHVDEVEGVATRVGIIQAGRASIEGRVDDLRKRVRRVLAAAPLEPPPGFARVRADVWQADGAAWEAASWPEGTTVQTLPLEEIFLAFARTDAPATAAA